MPGLDGRLARIERALADYRDPEEAAQTRALVERIFAQPEADQASFWRVWRTRWGTPAERDEAAEMCDGVLDVTLADRATFQRLTDEYFGPGPHPADWPGLDPTPALELA